MRIVDIFYFICIKRVITSIREALSCGGNLGWTGGATGEIGNYFKKEREWEYT
jgi:hypothetical protein